MNRKPFSWISMAGAAMLVAVTLLALTGCGPGAAPLGYSAENPATSNAQWTPVVEEFDGVAMALVPAGCFMMGSEDGQEDEGPVHEQCFDAPFWIDLTEVTNAGYGSSSGNWPGDDRPRDSVTWFQASSHCEDRGVRLPAELEWEYAARGPDGLAYPWGDVFVTENAVYAANAGSQTAEVGSREAGVSWVGALDMSGNLSEWTSSIYQPYPYDAGDGRENLDDRSSARVLRGGAWLNMPDRLRAADRYEFAPNSRDHGDVGFRCARDD